jgi:hypothetical protein
MNTNQLPESVLQLSVVRACSRFQIRVIRVIRGLAGRVRNTYSYRKFSTHIRSMPRLIRWGSLALGALCVLGGSCFVVSVVLWSLATLTPLSGFCIIPWDSFREW